MKRVAIVTFYFSPSLGGIERYLLDLAEASPSVRAIVAPAREGAGERDRALPRPVLRVPMLHARATRSSRDFKLLFPFTNLLLILGALRRLWPIRREIDVILAGSCDFAPAVAIVARLLGKPWSAVAYGNDVLPRKSGPLSWYKRRVIHPLLARTRTLYCISRYTADLVAGCGVPREIIRLMHPVVDSTRTSDESVAALERPEARAARLRLVTVGRLVERKGTALILRAIALLEPNERASIFLYVVGDGPERERLESLARELGIESRVAFLGAAPWSDAIMPHYRLGDVFLLPSFLRPGDVEGFGIVFLEAALYGLPSIGARSGGIPDAIEEGVGGLLVEPNSAEELAGVIRRFLIDPDLARRMGEAARIRAIRDFGPDRLREIFEKALEEEANFKTPTPSNASGPASKEY